MMRRTVERHLPVHPSAVAAALLDVPNWARWRPGVTKVSGVSDIPIRIATAWHETHTVGDRDFELLTRVVEFDPPFAISCLSAGDDLHCTVRWSIIMDDELSVVIQETGARSIGIRNALAGSAKRFLDQQGKTLDALYRYLQAAPPSTLVKP